MPIELINDGEQPHLCLSFNEVPDGNEIFAKDLQTEIASIITFFSFENVREKMHCNLF